MTNMFVVILYVILLIASSLVIILTLRKSERGPLDTILILIASVLIGWEFFEIVFYATPDPMIARYVFDLKLPFVALGSLSWFLFAINFYGIERNFDKPALAALLVIPVFTTFLALTTLQHELLREEFLIVQMDPMREYMQVRGPWFWLHMMYCYVLVVAGFIVGITQYRKTPKGHRLPSLFLVLGLAVSFVANIAVGITSTPIDLSLAGAVISLVLLYQATKNYQGLAFIIEARREAFHHIEEAIFILSYDGAIINMNKAAQRWLKDLGISAKKNHFSLVEEQIQEISENEVTLHDVDSGTDYYFENGAVYNIRKNPILNNIGKTIGYFAIISNETSNRELIEYLDKHSGLDALTGLSNRRQLEEDVVLLDKEENYPLAILFGDLNYLKETNDIYGHHQGDVLLRLVAEALRSVSPPRARLGRVGGDEFIILVPNCREDQADGLMQDIRAFLEKENKRYPFAVSIALGHAVKSDSNQSMEDLRVKADGNMYLDKSRLKQEYR